MTRAEQLVFCKKCTNRKLDFQKGMLCGLTDREADFETECPDYNHDETIKERLNDEVALDHPHVLTKLSTEAHIKLKTEQNYSKGVIFGVLTGLVGALVWAAITIITEYQIGYLALAIGAGVGFTIRYFGKGVDQIFGVTGGIIAILSCLLGNLFSIIGFIAHANNLGYLETFIQLNFSEILPLMTETFSIMDILFYGIAGYWGYKYAFRTFTEKELAHIDEPK